MSNEDKQAIIVNIISQQIDVIDMYLEELKPDTRQSMKYMINQILKQVRRFIKQVDSILNSKDSENFGIDADELKDKLDEYYGLK